MATAKRIEVVPVPPPATIELTLTEAEAHVLQDIANFIGGSPTKSRRGLVDGISNALEAVGISYRDIADLKRRGGTGLCFDNEVKP